MKSEEIDSTKMEANSRRKKLERKLQPKTSEKRSAQLQSTALRGGDSCEAISR